MSMETIEAASQGAQFKSGVAGDGEYKNLAGIVSTVRVIKVTEDYQPDEFSPSTRQRTLLHFDKIEFPKAPEPDETVVLDGTCWTLKALSEEMAGKWVMEARK